MTNYRGPPIWRRNLDVRPSAWPRYPTRKQSWVFGSSTKEIRLTSESYHHVRVSAIPSLGDFERHGPRKLSWCFFCCLLWRLKHQRKRSSCQETLAFGNARNFVKSLGSQFGSKQIRFSLTELIFLSRIWFQSFTSALIIDWAETPKTANLRSRAPAESREWSTPGGNQEVLVLGQSVWICWKVIPFDSTSKSMNQVNQVNHLNCLKLQMRWVGRVPLFLVCTLWTGFACLSVENPGGLCLAPSAWKSENGTWRSCMFSARDKLRWQDSRAWRLHQTFRKWTSTHIELGRYRDSRGRHKKSFIRVNREKLWGTFLFEAEPQQWVKTERVV